jgi:replicative DNA helicase
MPIRPNSESRLISALINTQEVEAAALYGVSPDMFLAYQQEYRWLIDFPRTYKKQPDVESLLSRYPDFPYSDSYSDVAYICDEVKDKHHERMMVQALKGAGEALRNGDTDEAYQYFLKVQHPVTTISYKLKNSLEDLSFLDTYEERIDTIEMPWKTLQKTTGGPAAGDYWTLAARLKQGKSWSLVSMIVHALIAGKNVMMFSCEMPEIQVMTRVHVVLAYELGIKDVRHSDLHGRNYDPIAYRKLIRQINEMVAGKLFVIDTSHGGISTQIISSLSKGMDFVVVDHLGLLVSPTGSRAIEDWRAMAMISNVIKEIAVVNNVPILAAAQINRDGDTNGWKPPKVKNLAQSDAIGQDSDCVITMKRRSKSVATYSIEVQRSGESGVLFSTRFLPNEGRFEEITMEKARDIADSDIQMEDDQ